MLLWIDLNKVHISNRILCKILNPGWNWSSDHQKTGNFDWLSILWRLMDCRWVIFLRSCFWLRRVWVWCWSLVLFFLVVLLWFFGHSSWDCFWTNWFFWCWISFLGRLSSWSSCLSALIYLLPWKVRSWIVWFWLFYWTDCCDIISWGWGYMCVSVICAYFGCVVVVLLFFCHWFGSFRREYRWGCPCAWVFLLSYFINLKIRKIK